MNYLTHMKYSEKALKELYDCPTGTIHRAVMITNDNKVIVQINRKYGEAWRDIKSGVIIDVNNDKICDSYGDPIVNLNINR